MRDRFCRRHSRRASGLSGRCRSWASIRGWSKEQRRGIFQIFNFSILAASLLVQIVTGFVKPDVYWLALIAFPAR